MVVSSFGYISARNDIVENSMCYGFIVPLPQGEDSTSETFANSKVRHLINDLLRENITVYWSEKDFLATSRPLNFSSDTQEIYYEKGVFIMPFSGDNYKDVLLTSIICDYNQTHELEGQDSIQVEAYMLMQEINFQGYGLAEPKIAQHLGDPVRYGWPVYLQIADVGGFLNFEFLLDNETYLYLDNENFNVFMWPYLPVPGTYYEQIKSLSNVEGIDAIRRFVRNGGGYIGSCYGAYAASSGFIQPLSLSSLRYAYDPDRPCTFPCYGLSLSDSLMMNKFIKLDTLYIATNKVTNIGHPLFFGVNDTLNDFFKGPWFVWLGKNTHVLSVYSDINSRDQDSEDPLKLRNLLVGRPNYVDTKFGDGKVVLFNSHPEFVSNIPPLFEEQEWDGDPYYGRRLIHNSLFYVTSEENVDTIIDKWHDPSFIETVKNKTNDLTINSTSNNEFDNIKQRTEGLSNNIFHLRNLTVELQELFLPYENKSTIFSNGARLLGYTLAFCEIYQNYSYRTITTVYNLEQVISMLLEFNSSMMGSIDDVKADISERLNKSEKLISTVITIAENLKEIMLSSNRILLQKLELLSERRNLLRTFEIGLKYIPQIYFQSLKLVRHLWYHYEANTAMIF